MIYKLSNREGLLTGGVLLLELLQDFNFLRERNAVNTGSTLLLWLLQQLVNQEVDLLLSVLDPLKVLL